MSEHDLEHQTELLPKIVGSAIREARVAKKWGVRELARRIGVSPGAIPVWERGQRTPSPLVVALIFGKLGVADDEQERILNLALVYRLRKILSTYPICTCGTCHNDPAV
ncbi:helix-turn-helix domain-containing protein [Amycolatopsis orientalis]|uniref:helix-turn-helix domain-containing protein n=1 Tax=Amycolatopsis orientalis TaxID=31958 RepID=UPI0003A7840E|nr:helix-turn-helix transcriptional regulator [Amycolatopsis orientalis]